MDDHLDPFDLDFLDVDLESSDCPRCQGSGKVPTADYESYFGAMYKPCPLCHGNPCSEEPPLS